VKGIIQWEMNQYQTPLYRIDQIKISTPGN